MKPHSYLVAAAVALAFSGTAFAQASPSPANPSPGATSAPSAGTSGKSESRPTTAAQCESLSGDRKAQCMQQAQGSGRPGSATGATPGSAGSGTGGGAASRSESAPSSSGPAK